MNFWKLQTPLPFIINSFAIFASMHYIIFLEKSENTSSEFWFYELTKFLHICHLWLQFFSFYVYIPFSSKNFQRFHIPKYSTPISIVLTECENMHQNVSLLATSCYFILQYMWIFISNNSRFQSALPNHIHNSESMSNLKMIETIGCLLYMKSFVYKVIQCNAVWKCIKFFQ